MLEIECLEKKEVVEFRSGKFEHSGSRISERKILKLIFYGRSKDNGQDLFYKITLILTDNEYEELKCLEYNTLFELKDLSIDDYE